MDNANININEDINMDNIGSEMSESGGESEKNRVTGGTLYLVGTPIGNMADLSPRAVKVLSEVDFIAAEDTRHTGRLLSAAGISKPMVSYYKDNMAESGRRIAERLQKGESCALCTDAGMPAISDPGEELVKLCASLNIPVTCVPGPCAAVTALSLSGADTRTFVFMGFLPSEGRSRRDALSEVSVERRTVVLYEAPHRLRRTLCDLADACGGERELAVCRELTKLNEQIIRATIAEVKAYYDDVEPRGEYVLVLHGKKSGEDWHSLSVQEHVLMYEQSGMSRMDAMKAAARDRGVGKAEIYKAINKK